MKKQFRKRERQLLLQQLNTEQANSIRLLALSMHQEVEILHAKISHIDREGFKLGGVERNGNTHEICLSFPKRVYDIADAEAAILEMLKRLEA